MIIILLFYKYNNNKKYYYPINMLETSNDEIYEQNKQKLEKKYELIETLAKGAFGIVYKAKDRLTNQIVAVKIITKNKAKKSSIQQIQRELSILQTINHPNVLKLIEYFETRSKVYIITEYIKYGNLKEFVTKNKGKITEQQSKQITYTLLQTVDYLHKYDICHRDLKLANIMLGDEHDFSKIKVIDFGLSIKFEKQYETGFCGTLKYMAPEMALGMKYTKKVDIWSVGIIFFILLNQGKHPFYEHNDNKKAYIKKLKNVNIIYPPTMSEESIDLSMNMLDPDPIMRFSASGCIKMPYFKKIRRQHLNISHTKKRMFKNMLLSMVLLTQFKKKSLLSTQLKKQKEYNLSHRSYNNYGNYIMKTEQHQNYHPLTKQNQHKNKNFFSKKMQYSKPNHMNITTYFHTDSNITQNESIQSFKLRERENSKGMSLTRSNWKGKLNTQKLYKPIFAFNNTNASRFYQKDTNVSSLNKNRLKMFFNSNNRGKTISSTRSTGYDGTGIINNNSKMSSSNVNSTLDTVRSGTGDGMVINNFNNFPQGFMNKMFVMTTNNHKKTLGNTFMKTFYKNKCKLPIIIKKDN